MLNVEVDLAKLVSNAWKQSSTKVDYLASDLRTTRFSLFGLDKRKADRENEEKRQEKVAEIHGCELPLLEDVEGRGTRGSRRAEASLQWRAEKTHSAGIICNMTMSILVAKQA